MWPFLPKQSGGKQRHSGLIQLHDTSSIQNVMQTVAFGKFSEIESEGEYTSIINKNKSTLTGFRVRYGLMNV